MAQVQLEIGGNPYVLSCRDGEEEKLRTMAGIVDAKAQEGIRAVGRSSEARTLLFAALLLADELQEGRARLAAADRDGEGMRAEMERLVEKARTDSVRAFEATMIEAEQELEDMRSRLAIAEEIARRPPLAPTPPAPTPPDRAPARAIESLADRVEALAARLEKAAASA